MFPEISMEGRYWNAGKNSARNECYKITNLVAVDYFLFQINRPRAKNWTYLYAPVWFKWCLRGNCFCVCVFPVSLAGLINELTLETKYSWAPTQIISNYIQVTSITLVYSHWREAKFKYNKKINNFHFPWTWKANGPTGKTYSVAFIWTVTL